MSENKFLIIMLVGMVVVFLAFIGIVDYRHARFMERALAEPVRPSYTVTVTRLTPMLHSTGKKRRSLYMTMIVNAKDKNGTRSTWSCDMATTLFEGDTTQAVWRRAEWNGTPAHYELDCFK